MLLYKRPYFFRHLYKDVNKEYQKFYEKNDLQSKFRFGVSLDEFLHKETYTSEEQDFYDYLMRYNPVVDSDSVMNNICHHIEQFKEDLHQADVSKVFFEQYYLYRNNSVHYTQAQKEMILTKYFECTKTINLVMSIKTADTPFLRDSAKRPIDNDILDSVDLNQELLGICSNIDIIVNVLIDYLYKDKPSSSKILLWRHFDTILYKNVVQNCGNVVHFPFEKEDGEIEYIGKRFSVKDIEVTV